MKKRVLMVSIEGLGNGGVQAVMMGIVRSLYKDYHFDMLVFTSEVRHYDEEFLRFGGKIFRIPHYEGHSYFLRRLDKYVRDIYVYRQVKKLLEREPAYDVIHCNKQFESAPILRAAAKHNIPVRICHTHVITFKTGIIGTMVNKIRIRTIEKNATHFLGCSDEACKSFFSRNVNCHVVSNFYDDIKYHYVDFLYREPVILTQVGAFSDIKNQLFSVKVLKEVLQRGMNAKLRLVGFEMQKGYKKQVVDEVLSSGLESKVEFFPGETDIPSLLADTHFFLMPSKHEGFGIVLVEAQAVGIRCIASNHVPQAANCGGVTYHDIDSTDSYHEWAEEICNFYEGGDKRHTLYNTDKYKLSIIQRWYGKLYQNKIQ